MSNPDQSPASPEPMFWVRLRSDGGYEGPIHNDAIERVRKESGGWTPLYPHVAPTEAAAMAAMVPAVAKFMGRRLTPEGTSEFWGVLLCDPTDDPAEGTPLHMAVQAPVAGQPAEPSPDRSPGFESLRLWWIMLEAQWELCEERPADDKVVLQFMGSGASHMVTAGEIRQALDVTEPGPQGR